MLQAQYLSEQLFSKWDPILNHADLPAIKGYDKALTIATVLENTEQALRAEQGQLQMLNELGGVPTNAMGSSSSTAGAGSIDIFDPVLISLVRRALPNLIAYDICGVQPMTGPTGIIFAMRSRYTSQTGSEAFYGEANTGYASFGGANNAANTAGGYAANANTAGGAPLNVGTIPVGAGNNSFANLYNYGGAMGTSFAEGLGSNTTTIFPQMAFSVEKETVTARTRALQAQYSMELAQDLKAIHGLDAETELANILSAEILAEINREVVRTINVTAIIGADQGDVSTKGTFDLDVDSNGRWSVEKFKGLMYQLERDANSIAKGTRRGKGNFVICSSDVASALQMAGVLSYTPALNSNSLDVDDTGNTFAGVLNGRIKVYIDPYSSGGNYYTMGYKGSNTWDAGLFYCPYVPLQMVRAVDPTTFQPAIGFKTRYGMVANPFAEGATSPSTSNRGEIVQDSNVYYRRVAVLHLL